MATDDKNLMRIAKDIVPEYRQCSRAGVVGDWTALSNGRVIDITLRPGMEFNTATVEIPNARWNAAPGVVKGYQIRLRYNNTVLFQGFIASISSGYSSAVATDAENPPQASEYLRLNCLDYRWLYNRCSPIYGQVARGVDDYNSNGTKKAQATFMSGLRCVFNPSGEFNMDPDAVAFTSSVWPEFAANFTTHVFCDPSKTITTNAWTVGEAINLLLSPIYNQIPAVVSITNPLSLPGLTHADFDTILHHVVVEGIGVIDAVAMLCDNIGWTFREEYLMTGPLWVFYKADIAAGTTRVYLEDGFNPGVLHSLHSPAVGEDIAAAVKTDGKKMVMAMDLVEDIGPVVNQPWGLAAPHQFEITAELVPAWLDTDLHIPASGTAGLFYTDSDLQGQTDPNSLDFFKYHHDQGSSFLRDVGRKWALNESGKYTGGDYDRGDIFDFTSVGISDAFIKLTYPEQEDKRLYGPFSRTFKPCLTFDKDSVNSVGIRMQWSRDGGTTWQELTCPADTLAGEAAIRLTIPNLSEIVDIGKASFSSGDYLGQEINFFTSLADDLHNSRVFKDGEWNTRLRITATIQMDQRQVYKNTTVYAGSPYIQTKVYDYADRYTLQQRCSSSSFYGGALPAWDTNEGDKLDAQMELIRKANEALAKHGRFVLDRLWIDGTNPPDIMPGDCVTGLTGRNFTLGQTLGPRTVYPVIVEVQYLIQSQKQVILIRDARLSIVIMDASHGKKSLRRTKD